MMTTIITMTKNQLPYSARKHIRLEKARIRREFLDATQRKEQITKLYDKFTHHTEEPKPKTKTKSKPKPQPKPASKPKAKVKKKEKTSVKK